MQSHYSEVFEREMGYALGEWLLRLPLAIGPHPWTQEGDTAQVTLGHGVLALAWRVLPPRAIALMRMPRLQVRYTFSGMSDAERQTFMRRFDLYTQRGGG